MRINLLFSMVGPQFSEELEAGFRAYAEWVVLNLRDERLLVDAIGDGADVAAAFNALDWLGRDPVVIGAWFEDGSPVPGYAFDLDAWLQVAPDVLSIGEDGEPVASRPGAWVEPHRWSGWASRQGCAPA